MHTLIAEELRQILVPRLEHDRQAGAHDHFVPLPPGPRCDNEPAKVRVHFHVSLELNGTLECPRGILGIGTAPQQSLAGVAIVTILLVADVLRNRDALRFAAGGFIASVVVGGVLGWLAIASSPPLPGPPTAPYESELEVCRPPFDAG